MSHHDEVVVGVDGSDAGELALEWAAAAAKRRGWSLRLVCSYSIPSFTAASLDGGYAALDDGAIRESAQAILAAALSRVAGSGVSASGTLETGDAAGALIEASRTAGLAVVGTRGGGGFTDRLLGTVSTAVPAHAHCPVVVVPRRTEDTQLLMPPRKIVVGVDGSPSARLALARAVEEAQLWDAELTVVAGVAMNHNAGMLAWLPAALDQGQVLADVKTGLEVVVSEAVGDAAIKVRLHALEGSGAALLAEFSSAVDLVVVGSRGRGGFAGMLLGSTSQSVLHHASCPVLVVPSRVKDEDGFSPLNPPWSRPGS